MRGDRTEPERQGREIVPPAFLPPPPRFSLPRARVSRFKQEGCVSLIEVFKWIRGLVSKEAVVGSRNECLGYQQS